VAAGDVGASQGTYSDLAHQRDLFHRLTDHRSRHITHQPVGLRSGVLKDYQLDGLNWLVSLHTTNLNGILADEMGLGKTLQVIALFCQLMETKNNHGPHLVICPLSVLETWRLELGRWAPHVRALQYHGNPAERAALAGRILALDFEVLLVQYEYVSRDRTLLSKVRWNYVVVDEGHRLKNPGCRLVRDLATYHSEHRLLLSGTPLQNNLQELWSLLHFLLPGVFDDGADFVTWFSGPLQTAGERPELSEEEQLLVIRRLHQIL